MTDANTVDSESRLSMKYTTTDIAVMAILGVAFGVLNLFFSSLWSVANASLGPLGGAAIHPFFIAPCLAAFLIRRPGVFLITYMITSIANLMAGNPMGILQIYWGLSGGLAGEVAFAIFRFRPIKIVPAIIWACILFIPFANFVNYFAFGWTFDLMFVLAIIVGVVTNIIMSGLVGIWLGKAVLKTGLLKSYAWD